MSENNNLTQTSLGTMLGVLGAAGVLTVVLGVASAIQTHQEKVHRAETTCALLSEGEADPTSKFGECVDLFSR